MLITGSETLGQLFVRRAEEETRGTVLLFGEESLSYDQLFDQAMNLARALLSRGVSPSDTVAVWLPNRPQWIVAEMATALIGATLVPVNVRLTPREARYVLGQSDPAALIMMSDFMGRDFVRTAEEAFPGVWDDGVAFTDLGLTRMRALIGVGPRRLPRGEDWDDVIRSGRSGSQTPEELTARQHVEDPMLVVWTSGTTSQPKGAVLDHRGLVAISQWLDLLGYTPEDRTVVNLPLYYIAGHYYGWLGGLLKGGSVILGERLDTQETLASISRHRGTMLLGGPSGYLALLAHPERQRHDLTSIRRGYVGGAAVTPQQIRAIREDLGVKGLVQVYGMTETHGIVSSTRPGVSDEELALTVGSPLDGVEVKVVDVDSREPIGPGEHGEMLVRGRTMTCYLNLSEEQQASNWDDGWFRTGDVLSVGADGLARFYGRIKDVIKSGGENVAAAEVESVIRASDMVEEVAVVGVPDAKRGEIVAAAVQFRPGAGVAASSDALIAWLRTQLAPFKVPRRIHPIDGSEGWPRNVSHKIVKTRVREMIMEAGVTT